jgi:hypothetical protein
MSLLHRRWQRRTVLLAAGALDEAESRRVRAHVEACAECARDLAQTRAALDLVGEDPVRRARPSIALGALVARVQARLDEAPAPRRGWTAVLAGAGAMAVIAVAALVARSALSPGRDVAGSPSPGAAAVSPAVTEAIAVPPDAMRRLEHTLAREGAARYLSDAQDVLVTVAAAPQRCARRRDEVEVGAEAERSRELLVRRRLFVEMDGAAVVAARGVFDDVEDMLRQVAALDPCAHPEDLEAIRGEIARRRLLMKIDLMTRELQG